MTRSVRLSKPWQPLTPDNVERVGGTMGVYELADDDGVVLRIGYAGGRSRFGLAGELRRHIDAGAACAFRVEVTTAYLSRYTELLMVHLHDHGRLPDGNDDDVRRLGRIRPA